MRIKFCSVFHYADDGIDIYFPDIPNAITCSYSKEEAVKMEEDVLELVLHGTQHKDLPNATPRKYITCDEKSEIVDIAITMKVEKGILYGNHVVAF